jgi:hypothetical protein
MGTYPRLLLLQVWYRLLHMLLLLRLAWLLLLATLLLSVLLV